ncbi:MAG: hypothetical protein OXG74_14365 [Acidobacteria bacterium]|nr:hypothetical protein [Acidobacteriota bacterium]
MCRNCATLGAPAFWPASGAMSRSDEPEFARTVPASGRRGILAAFGGSRPEGRRTQSGGA